MAYNNKEVLKDVNGNTIPQYYNPVTDSYEPLEGKDGSNKVSLLDSTGTDVVSTQVVQPILDKLDQLTGTVLAEENRKVFEDYNQATQYYVGNKVSYENTTSGLTATTVQDAIDEVDADLDAHKVSYV